MRVKEYIYNSETAKPHVQTVLDRIERRGETETADLFDLAAVEDRDDAVREAMLRLRNSVRIGTNPDDIYDEDGDVDFSTGVLVTEEPTGRRTLHVGTDALEALEKEQ